MAVGPVQIRDDLRGGVVDRIADLGGGEDDVHIPGPEAEERPDRLRIHGEVVFGLGVLRERAAHHDRARDLPADELRAAEGRQVVRRRLQQLREAGEEADRADRDAAVGLRGEEPAVEDPAVGASVGTGRGAGEEGASVGARRVRHVRVVDEDHRLLRTAADEADGQLGAACPRKGRRRTLACRGGRW